MTHTKEDIDEAEEYLQDWIDAPDGTGPLAQNSKPRVRLLLDIIKAVKEDIDNGVYTVPFEPTRQMLAGANPEKTWCGYSDCIDMYKSMLLASCEQPSKLSEQIGDYPIPSVKNRAL